MNLHSIFCLVAFATATMAVQFASAAASGEDQLAGPRSAPSAATAFAPSDIARPRDLPPIGKWMIGPDGSAAHWLGEIVDGKVLREPINVINC